MARSDLLITLVKSGKSSPMALTRKDPPLLIERGPLVRSWWRWGIGPAAAIKGVG